MDANRPVEVLRKPTFAKGRSSTWLLGLASIAVPLDEPLVSQFRGVGVLMGFIGVGRYCFTACWSACTGAVTKHIDPNSCTILNTQFVLPYFV